MDSERQQNVKCQVCSLLGKKKKIEDKYNVYTIPYEQASLTKSSSNNVENTGRLSKNHTQKKEVCCLLSF